MSETVAVLLVTAVLVAILGGLIMLIHRISERRKQAGHPFKVTPLVAVALGLGTAVGLLLGYLRGADLIFGAIVLLGWGSLGLVRVLRRRLTGASAEQSQTVGSMNTTERTILAVWTLVVGLAGAGAWLLGYLRGVDIILAAALLLGVGLYLLFVTAKGNLRAAPVQQPQTIGDPDSVAKPFFALWALLVGLAAVSGWLLGYLRGLETILPAIVLLGYGLFGMFATITRKQPTGSLPPEQPGASKRAI